MTELERHLLDALKRLEAQQQERDRAFAATLTDLTTRLNDWAGRTEVLTAQLGALANRIERLQSILMNS